MTLTQVCEAVASVLAAVELPSESAAPTKRVNKAFEVPPPKALTLKGQVPCFMVWADSIPERLRLGDSVEVNQTLQIDFFGEDVANGLRYAREFFDATCKAINDQQRAGTRFGELVDYVGDPRTERPQEALMEWAGLGFPGWRLYLDLQWFEDVS